MTDSSLTTTGEQPSPGDWKLVETLLHEALDKDPSARAKFLKSASPDSGVRDRVESLLRAHEQPGRFDALSEAVMNPLLKVDRSPAPSPLVTPTGSTVPDLERYRIVEKLGGGGMGIVYRARDERLDRDVALKFLPPHLSADAAAKKRFLVEARAAASLEHPNICTVHEIGETPDGQLYIVMGCYEGQTLDKRIDTGPLAPDEALRIAIEVGRGLAKAHDRRIVHRDIKPSNIMLTSDGLVKILDFGIAKLSDANVTQTFGVIGTLAYMSPEQAFGDVVDARADIWALGVVLYEMLMGQRPFGGPGQQALLYSILTAQVNTIDTVREDLTPGIDALLRRALAKKPDDRFASVHEMLAALSELQTAVTASPGPALRRAPQPVAMESVTTVRTESLLALAGERRHAAVVVTGIAGHAALVERLAPAEIDRVSNSIREIANEVATRYGGIVNHFAPEEAVLIFGVTESHEDDSLRAVRAALELHARVRALPAMGSTRVLMRSGVHTGALVVQRLRAGDRRFRLTGAPVDLATRLAALASSDALLLSPDAHRLVASFVETEESAPLTLQPDAPPVTPHRVTGEIAISSRLEIAERARLTPFAGRSRELQSLEDLLTGALSGDGGMAVVLGEPGAGKSRLLFELRRRVGETPAQLVLGRCDAYGGTTPYLPFVQALRELLGFGVAPITNVTSQQVAERLRAIDDTLEASLPLYCALLSVESTTNPLPRHLQGEHLQAAMLEALAALVTVQAQKRPLVILLEDWHWSDEASRRALDQLSEVASAHPLFIVVTSRPESGIEWGSNERGLLLQLRPLTLEGSTEIISGVLGSERVAADLAQQLFERTGGNPFFLEETCHALHEQDLIVVRDGEAIAEEPTALMRLPETVQAVIRTRLDRLTPETRDTLRVASVIGREFTRAVLDELVEGRLDDGGQLNELRRTGLIQQTSVAPEPAYRFKHVLTQEVAYDTLLEHQRETLHGKAAAAIERRYPDRLDDHRERLAHHYSRAGQWLNATGHSIHAADRSQSLSQFADALVILDRTRGWLDKIDDAKRRSSLLADILFRQERLCETLGLRARQITIVEELIALLAPHGGSRQLAEAYLRQGDVFTLLRRFDAADRSLETALRLSRELGDRSGERNASRSVGLLRSYEGRYEEAVASIQHALTLDIEFGDTSAAAGDIASLGNVLRKMGRAQEAITALEQAREQLSPDEDPMKWCAVLTVIAAAHRDMGDDEMALRYLREVGDTAIERKLPIMASFSLPAIAHIQLQRGEVEAGLATYRRTADLSRRARHADGLATALRAMGEVLIGLGRFAEAIPPLQEASDMFAQLEDSESESLLWQRLATAHEHCGHPAEAQSLWVRVHERREKAEDPAGEAIALEGIARCARKRGVRGTAIGIYERALGRAIAAADHQREGTLRNTLGLLRWEDGDYTEALRHYEVALRLCREREDRVHEGLILNSIGATLLKLRRYDEARTALEQAARLNAETGEQRLEAHSYAVLGDSFLAMGHIAEARSAFERSLCLRPPLGDRRGEGWMLERIGRTLVAEHPGEARAALNTARVIAAEIGDEALTAALDQFESAVEPQPKSTQVI